MTGLEKIAGEALLALDTYNQYDIKTDRYAHSTDLIYELRVVLNHKRTPLREPVVRTLFKRHES
jgi:phosphoribosyl-ATP pyrophosphohydrolase